MHKIPTSGIWTEKCKSSSRLKSFWLSNETNWNFMQIWKNYAKHFNRWGHRSLQLHQSNQQSRRTCQTTGTGQLALVPSVKFRPPPTDGVGVARSFFVVGRSPADERRTKWCSASLPKTERHKGDEWMNVSATSDTAAVCKTKERSVSRSLRPFGTRAKKKQMKEDHSGNNEKDPKLAILELLAASPSLWPVWKMDVDGCAIKWRCKHGTWFA